MAGETGPARSDARSRGGSVPTRSVEEITREIKSERAALETAFAGLQRDAEETVDQIRRQVTAAGRKALVVGPAIGAAAGGLLAGVVLLGRRRRRKGG